MIGVPLTPQIPRPGKPSAFSLAVAGIVYRAIEWMIALHTNVARVA